MKGIAWILAVYLLASLASCLGVEYPSGKLVIADYQGARATRTIGGTPGIWTYDGNALQSSVPNKRRVSNSDLLDANGRNQLAAMVYPVVGMQSQVDEEYLEYQILLAKAARIDGFVAEWSSPDSAEFLAMQRVAERLGFYVGANWCVSQTLKWDVADWEKNTLKRSATTPEKLEFGYDYARRLKAELYDKPTGLKLNGRPLLLLFGGDFFANADLPQLRTEWGGDKILLIGRYMLNLPDSSAKYVLDRGANLVDGFYPWSGSGISETDSTEPELAPLMAVPTHDSFYSTDNLLAYRERWIGYNKAYSDKGLPLRMGCVMPGADNRACGGWGTRVFYLARNAGETNRKQWDIYVRERENLDLVLIATWNDFTEDTVIEPSIERGQRDVEITEAGSAAFKGVASDPSGLPLPKRLFDLRKGYAQLRRLGFTATAPSERMDLIAQLIAGRQYTAAAQALSEEEERVSLLNMSVTSQPLARTVVVGATTEVSVLANKTVWLSLPPAIDESMSTLRCDAELTWEWLDSDTTSYRVQASNGTETGTLAQIIGTATGNWMSAKIKVYDENCPFARDATISSGKANIRFSDKVTVRNVVLKTQRKDLAPTVSIGPVAKDILAGGTLSLKVEAGATGTVSYQWRKDGITLPGKNTTALEVASFSSEDAGSYDCVVSSGSLSVTSASALVRLSSPPSILSQPEGGTLRVGEAKTLSVDVTSGNAGPVTYQWRKDSALISNGTQSSYSFIAGALSTGSYDVLISNQVGSVSSRSVKVDVVPPPSILENPVGAHVTVGSHLMLSVTATGPELLHYQWYKNDVPLESGTLASFSILSSTLMDAGTYFVSVSSSGTVVSSPPVQVAVHEAGISILRQPSDMTLLKGIATSMVVRVAPDSASLTRYQIFSVSGGTWAALPSVQGIVPALTGLVEIPLRNVSALGGPYVVQFTRDVGGVQSVATTQTFGLTVREWENGVGTYQALLADVPGSQPIGDGATARGLLTVSVNRAGLITGNLQYNESPVLAGTSDATLRTYLPMARSFTARMSPSPDNPLHLICTPKLTSGTSAASRSLDLDLDLSASIPVLNASVKDAVSVPGGNLEASYAESRCTGVMRSCFSLDAIQRRMAGQYTISTNASDGVVDASKNGCLFVQVLPSGRILWASRLKDYTGAGSSSLRAVDGLHLVAPFYEGQRQSSASRLYSTSLLGMFHWRGTDSGNWEIGIGASLNPDRFEKQSTYLNGSRDATGLFWTGVKQLSTSDGDSCRWNGAEFQSLFPEGSSYYLVAQDTASSSGAYAWRVTVNGAGMATAAGIPNGGSLPPPLLLRLDRSRGMWSGFYTAARLRHTLTGVVLNGPHVRGRGWTEVGFSPNVKASRWELRDSL